MSGVNTNTWNRLRYTLYAPFYDLVVRSFARARKSSIEQLAPQPGEVVLIVGAGTGLDLEHLPAGVRVAAVDLTPAMTRRAAQRADELGQPALVGVMDGQRLAFASQSVDHVILHLILAVIPDPERCIDEVARVLKPGGRITVFDKFLPDHSSPSPARRLANLLTNIFATTINRQLGPLLAHAGLALIHEQPALLGGLFKLALVEKPRR